MRKLISILVAAMFAMSSGFAVAADTGAKPMEKKEEMKKGDKKPAKKAAKKAKAAKKDEMKK
jgi:hypothetical protein